jgi:ribose transport system substrate-binding protein
VGAIGDPFSDAVAKGAEAEARELNPAAKVTVAPRDGLAARQEARIESLLGQHVNVIVLVPAEPVHLSAVLQKARDAGVVVVAVEQPAEGTVSAAGTGRSEEAACNAAVNHLDGRGDVVIVAGPVATAVLQDMQRCTVFEARTPQGFVDATASQSSTGAVSLGRMPKVDSVVSLTDRGAGAAPDSSASERGLIVATAEDSAGVEAALKLPALQTTEAAASRGPAGMGRLAVRLGLSVMHQNAGGT